MARSDGIKSQLPQNLCATILSVRPIDVPDVNLGQVSDVFIRYLSQDIHVDFSLPQALLNHESRDPDSCYVTSLNICTYSRESDHVRHLST